MYQHPQILMVSSSSLLNDVLRATALQPQAVKLQQAVAWLTTETEKGVNSVAESGWINEGDVLAEFS